jgi:hypothetical protein
MAQDHAGPTPNPAKQAAIADRSPASRYYEPVLSLGNASAPSKVYFFWSAVSPKSLLEFRKRIIPLAMKKEQARVQFLIYQLLDKDAHDLIGPGAYLLCPDSYDVYSALAASYLADASDVRNVSADRVSGMYANAFIRKLAAAKRLDRVQCPKSSSFATRQFLLVKETRGFFARYRFNEFPFYVIDGSYFAGADPKLDVVFKGLSDQPKTR